MNKKIINDWEYVINGSTLTKFRVIPPEFRACPDVLYKIYGVTKYSTEGLEEEQLYASFPGRFNDPFDSHFQMLKLDDPKVFANVRSQVPDEFLLGKTEKDQILTVQQYYQELFFQKYGIICLSENPNSIPMWAYYGMDHRGFIIGFDHSKFGFEAHGPFPVNYCEKIHPISIKEYGETMAQFIQTNLKLNDWKHETEWRLLADSKKPMETSYFLKGGIRTFGYSPSSVKMIGLGFRFFDPNEKEVGDEYMVVRLEGLEGEKPDEYQKYKERILRVIISKGYETCIILRSENEIARIEYARTSVKEIRRGKFRFDRIS